MKTIQNQGVASQLRNTSKTEIRFLTAIAFWVIVATVLAFGGLFEIVPLPFFGLLVFALIGALVVFYAFDRKFRQYLQSMPYRQLVFFHVWRVPAGFIFLYYGSQHLLPAAFVNNAAYGDILAGCLVPVVLLLAETPRKYFFFHIVGLLDFLLAVGTGLLFSVLDVPLMHTIESFPLVLIPVIGVPISGALHMLALHSLWVHHKKAALQGFSVSQ